MMHMDTTNDAVLNKCRSLGETHSIALVLLVLPEVDSLFPLKSTSKIMAFVHKELLWCQVGRDLSVLIDIRQEASSCAGVPAAVGC